MERNLKDFAILLIKGMGMGAADVVPGVSGGTIAFIVGIYEELINSIKSINFSNLKLFFTFKWGAFWKKINGNFLLAILSGILISLFSLAKIITYLLENQPILIWSFFFGLVIASTFFVSKQITKWNLPTILSFAAGAAIAYYITVATPAQTSDSLPFIFVSGAIAICAMILPGISGSFILVLLGKYYYILGSLTNLIDSIKQLNFSAAFKSAEIIFIFALGAAIGLISFSNVLSFLLRKYHNITIALLAGFMLGSLNKVWPWKEQIGSPSPDGILMTERNILPNELVWQGIVLMVFGFALVYVIELLSSKIDKKDKA